MSKYETWAVFGWTCAVLLAVVCVLLVAALVTAESGSPPNSHDLRAACRNHNGVRAVDEGHLICLDGATPEVEVH